MWQTWHNEQIQQAKKNKFQIPVRDYQFTAILNFVLKKQFTLHQKRKFEFFTCPPARVCCCGLQHNKKSVEQSVAADPLEGPATQSGVQVSTSVHGRTSEHCVCFLETNWQQIGDSDAPDLQFILFACWSWLSHHQVFLLWWIRTPNWSCQWNSIKGTTPIEVERDF